MPTPTPPVALRLGPADPTSGCETWADFRKTTGDLAMEHGHLSNRNGDLI